MNKAKRLQGKDWKDIKPYVTLGKGFLKSDKGNIRVEVFYGEQMIIHWLNNEEKEKFIKSPEYLKAKKIRENYYLYEDENRR